MRAHPEAGSGIVAHVEANVIATVLSCDGLWCRIGVGDVRGYIEQSKLWGVYPGETIR
jgi:SH3-like domain-containing protein